MAHRSVGTRSVGVGDVSLATAAARGVDRAGVARALSAALESGLELVDISAEEDSERLTGETIRELRLRDKAIAAPRIPAIHTMAIGGGATRNTLTDRLPAKYVVARVEAALKASKLDALPLAQLELRAAWRASSAWPELVGTCARLVYEGKVLAWGALVDAIEDDTSDLALEPWLDSLSLPYSLCERGAEATIAAAAKATEIPNAEQASQDAHLRAAGLDPMLVIAAGLPAELVIAASRAADAPLVAGAAPKPPRDVPIAILARRPLAGAALAGTLGPGARLRQRDDRNGIDAQVLDRVALGVAKLAAYVKHVPPAARANAASKLVLERMKRPNQLHCESLAELALRFVITRGAIALPRLHRHEHVLDSLAASVLPPLPPDLLEVLDGLDI